MDESTTKRCTIEDCGRTGRIKRGMCTMHYQRWFKHGDPLKTLTPNKVNGTTEERFWSKVKKTDGCWLWQASKNTNGYGNFFVSPTVGPKVAHRYAYETMVGPVPDDRELDHTCRQRNCVRPSHLEVVTHRENVQRGEAGKALAARQKAKTHCPKNHEYTEDNIYWSRGGTTRNCKTCILHKTRKRREARRKDER